MNPALQEMLSRYPRGSADESVNALREVLQELALLGLWRGKFFEQAAFYGGTALRILYGLDRFSEDMDFSLLQPDANFSLERYLPYVERELQSWGFHASVEAKAKTVDSAIESAFLKANTREQLLVIEAEEEVAAGVHPGQVLRVKFEVDTDPPPDFSTETKFCLQPIPFSVLTYSQPSLFAGKMHALLCRTWGRRVKGRDWYDFVWYVGRGTELDLHHLEARMRQSGHYDDGAPLTESRFREILAERIASLDVARAKADVVRFLPDASSAEVWSREFFTAVADKVEVAPLP
ncbi:MAG: nucleotidyl transferase AbiEii/AbiGii toxin family protein [Deferrisomatales bacterium]|nr:nucleotidyl transferase AbiEii/AbiGii toxin family protein [Deferrisomatales bacterium]